MERYRRTVRGGTKNEDKVDFKVKIMRQSIVCVIIFVSIFLVSLLRTNTAQKLNERIGYTLSYTVDYKSAFMDIVNKITAVTKGE